MKKKTVFFYAPQREDLAKKIARTGKFDLGKISWGVFPDCFPNIFIEDVKNFVKSRNVVFLASFGTPGEIFEQLGVIYALPRYGADSFKIILPYFPVGTMERVTIEGEVATAMTLARMMSAVECVRAPLIIYDIHALPERFYFRHPIEPWLESGIPLFKNKICNMKNLAIAFPDEGAYKRFAHMFAKCDQVICHKVRDGAKRIVTIKEGNVVKKNIVIVDDLVMTGGTLVECAKVLRKAGAKSVSAYATHAVFPMGSWAKISTSVFDKFWITDSCRMAELIDGRGPFEVLSLASPIAKLLAS